MRHVQLISLFSSVIRSHSTAPQLPDDDLLGLRFVVAETAMLRRMAETRLPVTIPDIRKSDMWVDKPVLRWVRAYVGVPIVVGGDVMGFLNLNSATPGFFTTEHARRLRAFAHQAGVAIRNASLFARTKNLLKTTEQQARRMRDLFDTVSDGLVLLDQARRVVRANPLGLQYLDSLCGDSDGELDHLGPEPLDRLLADAPGAPPPVHEIEVTEPRRRMFELRVHRLAPGHGDDGWLLVLHDATEEHERQMYLQGQSQLATVGRLAAGIAHDFNNIMAVITLYSQIMMGEDLSVKNRERLRVDFRAGQERVGPHSPDSRFQPPVGPRARPAIPHGFPQGTTQALTADPARVDPRGFRLRQG
jgi:PAS domain-containing protein